MSDKLYIIHGQYYYRLAFNKLIKLMHDIYDKNINNKKQLNVTIYLGPYIFNIAKNSMYVNNTLISFKHLFNIIVLFELDTDLNYLGIAYTKKKEMINNINDLLL
jgi:hypothetical protein